MQRGALRHALRKFRGRGCSQRSTARPPGKKLPYDGYIFCMGTHSVADAKNRLPELIDRALKGESVVITRHGRPVAELRPIPEPAHKVSAAALDWLAARRVGVAYAKQDAGAFVSRMRDEDKR